MNSATIDLDYVVFNSSAAPDLDAISNSNLSAEDGSDTNIGAIAGGAAGGGVALILLVVSVWWFLRQRRKREALRVGRVSPMELAHTDTYTDRPSIPPPSSDVTTDTYAHEVYELSYSPISTLAPASVMPAPGSALRSPLSPIITQFAPASSAERLKEGEVTEHLLPEAGIEQPRGERELDMGPLRMTYDSDEDEAASLPQSTLPPDYFQATGQTNHRLSELITGPTGAQRSQADRLSL